MHLKQPPVVLGFIALGALVCSVDSSSLSCIVKGPIVRPGQPLGGNELSVGNEFTTEGLSPTHRQLFYGIIA